MTETSEHDPQLEATARRLGGAAAARLDVERVANRVLERLRAGDRIREPVVARRGIAAAAAVVVLVGGTLLWRAADTAHPQPAQAVAPVPLGDLEPHALAEVLDSLTLAAPAGDLAASATLDDLDELELRELLATMEG